MISASLATALDFSGAVSSGITTANPLVLGFAVPVMGVDCEHRALRGVAANINTPNDRNIETVLLTSVAGAVAPLTPFLTGGEGYSGPFGLPGEQVINRIAQPCGFSFFPKYKVV